MKKYQITIFDAKTKKQVDQIEEISKTKKYLVSKYEARTQFTNPPVTFKVKRMFRKPVVQMDMLDFINEIQQEDIHY